MWNRIYQRIRVDAKHVEFHALYILTTQDLTVQHWYEQYQYYIHRLFFLYIFWHYTTNRNEEKNRIVTVKK